MCYVGSLQVLDDDYSKLAFLCADRSIHLHAKYGKHHSLRIPRMGRDMTYDNWSCDLLCAASSPDLYRINLEQGRFLSPLSTQSPALNVVSRSKLHGLVACGGEDGAVECFDMRMKSSAARINAVTHGGDAASEVTAIEFDDSEGLQVAVGSSAGKVFIYDLRTSAPIHVKDHMYESPILSIRWQRTLNTQQPKLITTDKQIVRIWDPNTVLDDDYSKLAFLCADRSIHLHAKYGKHHSLRIPRMGRDMTYDNWSCDLLCAASSPDLYRINLEQGRFLSPLTTQSPALNVVSRSNLHGLVACGGEDGAVECFDMRMKSSAARINAVTHGGDAASEVTAIEFDDSEGLQVAVGSSAGKVFIYDLRTSAPIHVKDHMYESPILSIKWQRTVNTQQPKLITTDKQIVRIWDPNTGEGMTSIQPSGGGINDICVFPGSGLMLLALDSSLIPSYFIPELGPAPKWCSPLENLTEEMEETGQTTIYDNYKFVTKEDLEKLRMTHLIGTDLLKAQMHGYFVNHNLYKKALTVADPFAYDKYLEDKKQKKLEADRSQRIT
ncbi:hypothetical protein F2Q70_00041030, partial [Brassica cretica]